MVLTSSSTQSVAALVPAILCGAIVPGVIQIAPDGVDEARGVHRYIEIVCLLRIQGIVLALQWHTNRLTHPVTSAVHFSW